MWCRFLILLLIVLLLDFNENMVFYPTNDLTLIPSPSQGEGSVFAGLQSRYNAGFKAPLLIVGAGFGVRSFCSSLPFTTAVILSASEESPRHPLLRLVPEILRRRPTRQDSAQDDRAVFPFTAQ